MTFNSNDKLVTVVFYQISGWEAVKKQIEDECII